MSRFTYHQSSFNCCSSVLISFNQICFLCLKNNRNFKRRITKQQFLLSHSWRKNLFVPQIELTISQTMIIEIKIYAISGSKKFSIHLYMYLYARATMDSETRRKRHVRFICIYRPVRILKQIIIFTIRSIYEFPVPRGNPPSHCHVPIYPRVWFFCICYYTRARASDVLYVQHDHDPFRMDIRIYEDRERVDPSRGILYRIIYPMLQCEGPGKRRYCENIFSYFHWKIIITNKKVQFLILILYFNLFIEIPHRLLYVHSTIVF